jgi:DNA-binding FrmR family transcriptional regulator
MRHDIKTSCQKRLTRIEGQVRGLSRMVEEDRYCIDIVTQISAVRAALRRVEEEILRDHVGHCVEHAIASGNKAEQRRIKPGLINGGWVEVTEGLKGDERIVVVGQGGLKSGTLVKVVDTEADAPAVAVKSR